MSKSKVVGMMVLIVFAMTIILAGNALAGEKIKWRAVWYMVKAETVNVPSEEGRILILYENKGILSVFQGNKAMDGLAGINVGVVDANTKTGAGFGHGELHFFNAKGDKMYWKWEGKGEKGVWSGQCTAIKGTGKFEGLKGQARWTQFSINEKQNYVEWEGELE